MAEPWLRAADPVGAFDSGVDMYLRLQQARDRKKQMQFQDDYRTAQLKQLGDYHESLAEARKQTSEDRLAALKERTENDFKRRENDAKRTDILQQSSVIRQKIADARTKIALEKDSTERAKLQANIDRWHDDLEEKQIEFDTTSDQKQVHLDNEATAERDRMLSAGQRNDTSGFKAIADPLIKANAAKPADQQEPLGAVLQRAKSYWQSIRESMNPPDGQGGQPAPAMRPQGPAPAAAAPVVAPAPAVAAPASPAAPSPIRIKSITPFGAPAAPGAAIAPPVVPQRAPAPPPPAPSYADNYRPGTSPRELAMARAMQMDAPIPSPADATAPAERKPLTSSDLQDQFYGLLPANSGLKKLPRIIGDQRSDVDYSAAHQYIGKLEATDPVRARALKDVLMHLETLSPDEN